MDRVTIKTYAAGKVIFTQDAYMDGIYLIHKGRVEISQRDGSQKDVITVLEKNNFFGEMALLSKIGRRSATATALEETVCYHMSEAEFSKELSQASRAARELFRDLALTIYLHNKTDINDLPEWLEQECTNHLLLNQDDIVNNQELQKEIALLPAFLGGIYRVLMNLAFK